MSVTNTVALTALLILPNSFCDWSVAAQAPPQRIIVRTYRLVSIPDDEMRTAWRVAQAIFRSGGLEVDWLDCSPSTDACARTLQATEVVVRVAARPTSMTTATLGFSYVDNVGSNSWLTTVFADAVATFADKQHLERGTLLGRTLAHEIGHLLLESAGHSSTGLMRAFWSDGRPARDVPWDWLFRSSETRQMRRSLTARLAKSAPQLPILAGGFLDPLPDR